MFPCFQNRSDQDVHSGAPEQLELLVQLLPGRGDGDAVLHSGLPAALPAHVRAEEEGSRQRLEEKGRLKVLPNFFGPKNIELVLVSSQPLKVSSQINARVLSFFVF